MDDRAILRQIEDNDLHLIEFVLRHWCDYFDGDGDGDWEGLGNRLAKNTRLRKLAIDIYEVTDEDMRAIFDELSNKIMLRELDFTSGREHLGEEAMGSLAAIFKNNNIERLEISCNLPSLHLLASALAEGNSLKSFDLHVGSIVHGGSLQEHVIGGVEKIIKALSGHRGLEELILQDAHIGRDGCSLLLDMLQCKDSKLAVLHLNNLDARINNEQASILAHGLSRSSTLRDLSLRGTSNLFEKAWQCVFLALKSKSCNLENLSLTFSYATFSSPASFAGMHLFDALANNMTLKALNLEDCFTNIAMTSWHALSGYLRNPRCQLEIISLQNCGMNDESIECFSNSMASNSSVKKLRLRGNTNITPAGWVSFSTALESPSSALESLDLGENEIDDEAIEILCVGISRRNNLKKLDISDNHNISSQGWRTSVPVLLDPNSSLEKLYLEYNHIDHDTLISFMPAFESNGSLKVFLVYNDGSDDLVPLETDSWAAFLPILCDGSSIMGTYQSNHSLHRLERDEWTRAESELPFLVDYFLRINRRNSKSQAARLKIVLAHFGEGFIAPPFTHMGAKLLPHALAWMSRAIGANELDGHFYEFVKDFLLPQIRGVISFE